MDPSDVVSERLQIAMNNALKKRRERQKEMDIFFGRLFGAVAQSSGEKK